MAKRKYKTMTEVLRQAIIDSGLPLLTLSKESGVERASLRRFVNGERSLRLDMADKLAAYFELSLEPIN
jgi:plasmid maintenance system antidote protein VapI